MRSPLWILNSFLLLMLIATGVLLWVTRPYLPPPVSLEPRSTSQQATQGKDVLNTSVIVERDLFATRTQDRSAESPHAQPTEIPIPTIPQPPRIRPIEIPRPTPPTFLPPLEVQVKGVITSEAEEDNRVILADTKSKEEDLYQVGDTIADAEIVRILPNRVIFARPNGQMETVFLSTVDAHHDPDYHTAALIKEEPAVKALGEAQFQIDPDLFAAQIINLAQLIDQLDITTALRHGISIGCKIGELTPHSIGTQLGLNTGDIVTHIKGNPLRSTEERLEAYRTITKLHPPEDITVDLLRNGQTLQLTYKIVSFAPPKKDAGIIHGETAPPPPFEKSEKRSSGGLLKELHKDAKAAMLEYGGKAYAEHKPLQPMGTS